MAFREGGVKTRGTGRSKALCGTGARTRPVAAALFGTAARTSLLASKRWTWTHLGDKAAAVGVQVEIGLALVPAHLTVQVEDRADRAWTLAAAAATAARAALTVQVGGAQDLASGRVSLLSA